MNHSPIFNNGSWYPQRSAPALEWQSKRGMAVDDVKLAATCIFSFLAPFNLLRIDAIYFTASDAFATLLLFAMIFDRSLAPSPWGLGNLLWNAGASLFVGALLASSLLYGDSARGFIVSIQYLFAFVLVGYAVLSLPRRDLTLAIKSFILSMMVICLHGIYVINILHENHTRFVSGNGRLLGFVERENECGVLIALTAPLALWLVQSGNGRALWLIVGLPLLTYGVILTGSNTALMTLVYGVAASVVLTGSLRQMLLLGTSASALFMVAVNFGRDFLPGAFQRRVLGALETGDVGEAGTFLDRVALMREAWGKIEHSMFLGIGADQYREVSAFHAPVHNIYLLVWMEAGFLGLVGYLTMFIAALLLGLAAFRLKGARVYACCTLTLVSQFLIAGNTFPHMYGRYLVVPLLLSIALSTTAMRDGGAPRVPFKRARRVRALA